MTVSDIAEAVRRDFPTERVDEIKLKMNLIDLIADWRVMRDVIHAMAGKLADAPIPMATAAAALLEIVNNLKLKP